MLYYKKIVLEYIGTDFVGWQVQANGRSVQEELHNALSQMYKTKVTTVGSGRTDSGVHALGQVASFRTERYISPDAVLKGLNSLLPDDVSIISVEDMPEGFHAQASSKSKTYLFKIFASNIRSARYAGRSWWVKAELDYKKIEALLKPLEGEHDFSSFCMVASLKDDNIRRINSTKCYMDGDIICVEINGNGFLHNMVRIIVGTVVEAVRRDYGTDYIKKVLDAKDRNKAGPTAHAAGLYLKEVFY